MKIIVSGCLSERYKKELLEAIPEVDQAIGVRDPLKILEALNVQERSGQLLDEGPFRDQENLERRLYFSGLFYSYLKISEGCNRSCSFCAIPGIRGKQRSRDISSLIKEAEFLSSSGIRELILVSEDTISYGSDLKTKQPLIELLKELLRLDFQWIRLMYLYPDREIEKLAEFIAAEDRICNYLDLPLQHASGTILKKMKRAGNYQEYVRLIKKMRQINPEVRIRSSFIAGYPGETEKEFEELKSFLTEAELDRVGFFEYSDEEGTQSFMDKPKVPAGETKKRFKSLSRVQEDISLKNLEKLAGKTILCVNDGIIREEKGKRYMLLRSEYDAPEIDGCVKVELKNDPMIEKDFITVRIKKALSSHDLEGIPL